MFGTLSTYFVDALVIFIASVVLWHTIFLVPTNYYALIRRFDRYVKPALAEGLHWKIPFVDEIETFNRKLETIPLDADERGDNKEFVLQCKDGNLTIDGSFQYRPYAGELETYARIDKSTICLGVRDKVKAVLTQFIGRYEIEELVGKKMQIERLVNAILLMENGAWPHRNAGPEEILACYDSPVPAKDSDTSRSETEKLYGITIEVVTITNIRFPLAVEEARQKETMNKLRVKAAKVLKDATLTTIDELRERDLSSRDAATHARMVLGITSDANEQVITIQGKGAIPVQHLDDPRSFRATKQPPRKKD